MVQFFWESTQKARKEHFCWHCFNTIYPGDIYQRKIWKPESSKFFVMAEHLDPVCPPNEFEEVMQTEEIKMRVVITYTLQTTETLIRMLDGSIESKSEVKLVPKVIIESDDDFKDDGSEDIEFPF